MSLKEQLSSITDRLSALEEKTGASVSTDGLEQKLVSIIEASKNEALVGARLQVEAAIVELRQLIADSVASAVSSAVAAQLAAVLAAAPAPAPVAAPAPEEKLDAVEEEEEFY